MKRSFILILLLITAYGHVPATGAAELHEQVTVDSAVVRIGDLFDEAGEASRVVVSPAPMPGRRKVMGAVMLSALARRHGVDWTPTSRHTRAIVERAGHLVDIADIEAAVHRALVEKGVSPTHQVRLSNAGMQVYAATDQAVPFHVRGARHNARSGRFSATLVIPYGPNSSRQVPIAGRTVTMVQIPVLARPVDPGEVIRRDDLGSIEVESNRLRYNVVADAADLIGMTTRRKLQAGEPVDRNEVQPLVLVSRGSIATLSLRTANMVLTAKVRAVEDGARGETIRVINTRSKKVIEGVVSGPGQVSISITGPLPTGDKS